MPHTHIIFSHTIKEHANKCFARNCSFSALHSWGAWALCYNWVDEPTELTEGDMIAFVERLGRSPYPSLVVCKVIRILDGNCELMIVAHEARNAPVPESIILRSLNYRPFVLFRYDRTLIFCQLERG